jgi:hypothetical protein
MSDYSLATEECYDCLYRIHFQRTVTISDLVKRMHFAKDCRARIRFLVRYEGHSQLLSLVKE